MKANKTSMLAAMTRLCETRPYDFKQRSNLNEHVQTVISNAFYQDRSDAMRRIRAVFDGEKFNVSVDEITPQIPLTAKGFVIDGLNFVIISSMAQYLATMLGERYKKKQHSLFCKDKYVKTEGFKEFNEFIHSDDFYRMTRVLDADNMLRSYNSVTFTYLKYFVSVDYAIMPLTSKEYCDIERLVKESKQKKIEEILDKYAK